MRRRCRIELGGRLARASLRKRSAGSSIIIAVASGDSKEGFGGEEIAVIAGR